MSFRPLLRRRAIAPAAAAALAAGSFLSVPTIVHAEAPEDQALSKRPIYDDPPEITPPSSLTPSAPSKSTNPTPTDRLAAQIRKTRLFVHAHVAAAEDAVNDTMTKALQLENSFTSTVASLAPPKESGEQLLPGAIYVLIGSLSGSIIARNRNILVRASIPMALGIGTGWIVLPITMRNIGDLLWKYEERVPAIRDTHLQIRSAVQEAYRVARSSGESTYKVVDEKVGEARNAVEGWVRKGK